jgi:uncharacterized protein
VSRHDPAIGAAGGAGANPIDATFLLCDRFVVQQFCFRSAAVLKVQNVVGKPVQGNNFFGRERELLDLQSASETEHILLLAPRRVGKTSLLFALQAACEADASANAIYVSVASAMSERHVIQMLLDAVYASTPGKRLQPNRVSAWLRRNRRRVKNVQFAGGGVELAAADDHWQEDADEAMAPLLASTAPWLLLIDELPTLVLELARGNPTGERVRAFLQWFRNVRQTPAGGGLRFVLAGSIGLDSVTRRYRLTDTINDLRTWGLGPYSAETADRFLAELGRSYGMDLARDVRDRICTHAEWLIPYHLQVVFSALREERGERAPSVAAVDAAVERLLARKAYFNYWDERLRTVLGLQESDHAGRVLAACANDERGATEASLGRTLAAMIPDAGERSRSLAWLLDVLGSDGYLVRADRRWRFRSGLLRRYWKEQLR